MYLYGLSSVALFLAFSAAAAGQTAVSDPRGFAILSQALSASGVSNPAKPVQDFTATGTITFFWAAKEVSGPATVKGRGHNQFRLNVNLPEGTRSLALNRSTGALKEAAGSLKEIPLHNTINVGILTYPYLSLAAALNDPLTLVSYVGAESLAGRQVHRVRVQRRFPQETDPDGTLARLCTTDYFVDAQTYLVTKTLDMTHSDDDLREDFTREIEFENYAVIQGVNIPTLVREKIIGQTVWELRLTNISFNTGLTDLDFGLQ